MTAQQLKRIAVYATHANIILYAPLLEKFMAEYGITGKLREAAFIAQIIHESGSFKYSRETASGSAYEGRKDLGNIFKGDGVKYKGRGLIQITGRANYEEISKVFGTDFTANPSLLEQPEWAVKSACWWWYNKGLNRLADMGKFREITEIINGGYNGLADREKWYSKALSVLK